MIGRRGLLVLTCLAILSACSDEGPVSGAGTMTVTVTGSSGAEGAAVLTLLGEGIGEITPVGEVEVWAQPGEGSVRVVLIHPTGGDLAFRVAVPDTTQPPAWVLEEVAGPDDALRSDVSAYSLEFAR